MTERTAVVVTLILLAGACAAPSETTTRWTHPERPSDAISADLAACRAWATDRVERDVRRADYGGAGVTSAGEHESRMARHDAARRRDSLAAGCMRDRGYRPADGTR